MLLISYSTVLFNSFDELEAYLIVRWGGSFIELKSQLIKNEYVLIC